MVHDVSKSAIPNAILDKPTVLSPADWRMRRHAEASAESLRCSRGFSEEMVTAARNHHERLDGTGCPRGLTGCQIHDLSLVCSIVDVYCALTEKRSYKKRMSGEAVVHIMHDMAGTKLERSCFARFSRAVEAGEIV